MDLEQYLISRIKSWDEIYLKKMFGWMCIVSGRNFFGGYKIIDESIIILFLILSPEGFEKAANTGNFQKFEFGQTWVETELNRPEEVEEIWPLLKDAFAYCAVRKQASHKKP